MSFKLRLSGKRPGAASPSQPNQRSSSRAMPDEDGADQQQVHDDEVTDMTETGSANNIPDLATPKLRLGRRTAETTPSTQGNRSRSTPVPSSAQSSLKRSRKLHKKEVREHARAKSLNILGDLQSMALSDGIESAAAPDITRRPSPTIKLKRGNKIYVCHFFKLARELRDMVYEYHAEDYPVIISNKTSRLVCYSPVMIGSKQLCKEYVEHLNSKTSIYANIRNWDFSSTITFLNKLTVGERTMFVPGGRVDALRTITFVLTFSIPKKKYHDKFAQDDKLTRWIRRLADPSKNGHGIDFQYECETVDLDANMPLGLEHTNGVMFDLYMEGNRRSIEELRQINSALQEAQSRVQEPQVVV
ncbi:hypothetical protein HII31_02500 [Pseudocercospora fuligena]|uniref:Uncharacterized protein n=1 Tax=Pseudocercospora fuligena TaxID=685502 RepID=A0A8H6RRX5_9PEZI|nr:hypothetical protein HII31_02500 [Pseudocercospora fuligena]